MTFGVTVAVETGNTVKHDISHTEVEVSAFLWQLNRMGQNYGTYDRLWAVTLFLSC